MPVKREAARSSKRMSDGGDRLPQNIQGDEGGNGHYMNSNEKLAVSEVLKGKEGAGMDDVGRLRLLKKSEVPFWLAFNPYILEGYRWNLTWEQCFRSMFKIHNETGGFLSSVQYLAPTQLLVINSPSLFALSLYLSKSRCLFTLQKDLIEFLSAAFFAP